MKIPAVVLAALAVIGALLLVDTCARRSERQKLEARQRDVRDDSTVSRLAYELARAEHRLGRERDSTGREIRRLKARIAQGANLPSHVPPPTRGADSADVFVGAARSQGDGKVAPDSILAIADSLIAAYDAGRAQDSLQLLFWKSAVAQRDTVITQLQAARNSWREIAQRPRYTYTDLGGAALMGFGAAEKNPTVVAVGAGVILVPRALHLLGRIF